MLKGGSCFKTMACRERDLYVNLSLSMCVCVCEREKEKAKRFCSAHGAGARQSFFSDGTVQSVRIPRING